MDEVSCQVKTASAPALSTTKADSNEDNGASVLPIETIGLAELDDSDSNDIDPFDDFDDLNSETSHQRSETSHNDDSV